MAGRYYHHNWLYYQHEQKELYRNYWVNLRDAVTMQIWRMKYDRLHPISQSQINEQVAMRFNKEVLDSNI